MLIRELYPLVQQELKKITPSNLNWILKCPLRAIFANNYNRSYLNTSTSSYSMIGNVIHKINEDFTKGKINSKDDFEQRWAKHEKRESTCGLKGEVKNYGVFKSTTKSNILGLIQNKRVDHTGFKKFKFLPEEPLKDTDKMIEGKLDLLVLKEGQPYEIRDYKTGNIYDLDAKKSLDESGIYDDDEQIKEDYKKQLFLYAWLVKKEYKSFPEKLTIVTNEGTLHPIDFKESEIQSLINELDELKVLLGKDLIDALPKPSIENCKFCNFRFDCQYRILPPPDSLGDLYGRITTVTTYPFGNLSLVLDGMYRVVFPDKIDNPEAFRELMGCFVIVTFVRRYFFEKEMPEGLSEFYVPTRRTELLKMSYFVSNFD